MRGQKQVLMGVLRELRKHSSGIGVVLVCIGVLMLVLGARSMTGSREVMALPLEGKIIVIDPGHGGIDAGATANGAVEKELNLSVSEYLRDYIESSGGLVYMTRIDDSNTADPDRPKGITQKMSDLKNRKQSIEDCGADMFISIHMNKFAQSKYKGLQVFYGESSKESRKLGEEIQKSVVEVIQDGNTRKAKSAEGRIYVLKENKIPSVLVECGFLSNAEEAENLKNPEYQRRLAWSIYLGIVRSLSR